MAASWLQLTNADVLLFYTVALFTVGGVQRFLDAYSHGVLAALASLFAVNAGEFLALIAIYWVLKSKPDNLDLSGVDFAIIAFCATFFLLPEPTIGGGGDTDSRATLLSASTLDMQLGFLPGRTLNSLAATHGWKLKPREPCRFVNCSGSLSHS